ncbi:MAG TPA: AraC family transcriptional regulator [Blastocatellia bacterium]|nr:AraC family transcriptional regulator [Blastocatellia bacterium]
MQDTHVVLSRPQFSVRHTSADRCEFEPHAHPAYGVAAILNGSLSGSIGDEIVDLHAGEAALINVGQFHSAKAESVEFVSTSILPSLVADVASEIGSIHNDTEIVFRASVARDESIAGISRQIAVELSSDRLGREAMLDSLARQLVINLLRSHFTIRRTPSIELSRVGPVDRRLRRAVEFMHDNYSRELAVEEIASAAYLSEFHFARLFKQILGVTPHMYLANLRLEEARRLLSETELSISEVAAMVGYQSQSHFTRVFKAVTGITPRCFRQGR